MTKKIAGTMSDLHDRPSHSPPSPPHHLHPAITQHPGSEVGIGLALHPMALQIMAALCSGPPFEKIKNHYAEWLGIHLLFLHEVSFSSPADAAVRPAGLQ